MLFYFSNVLTIVENFIDEVYLSSSKCKNIKINSTFLKAVTDIVLMGILILKTSITI